MKEIKPFKQFLVEAGTARPGHVYAHIKHYDRHGPEESIIKISHREVKHLFNGPRGESPDDFNHAMIKRAIHGSHNRKKHRADWNNSKSLSVGHEEFSVGLHPTKAGATANMNKADRDAHERG